LKQRDSSRTFKKNTMSVIKVTVTRDGAVTELLVDGPTGAILSSTKLESESSAPLASSTAVTVPVGPDSKFVTVNLPTGAPAKQQAIYQKPATKSIACNTCPGLKIAGAPILALNPIVPGNNWSLHKPIKKPVPHAYHPPAPSLVSHPSRVSHAFPVSNITHPRWAGAPAPAVVIDTNKALQLAIESEKAAGDTAQADIKMQGTELWDKTTWKYMFTQAHYHSETPTQEQITNKYNLFKAILDDLLCPTCKVDSKEWERSHPLSKAVRSRSKLLELLIDLHNHITHKKGSGNIWKLDDTLRIFGFTE
jgi:hypothetical protein